MLANLCRLGASSRVSPLSPLHLSLRPAGARLGLAHIKSGQSARTVNFNQAQVGTLAGPRNKHLDQLSLSSNIVKPARFRYLASQPPSTAEVMFKAAVKSHGAAIPAQTGATHAAQQKQQNIVGAFKSSQGAQRPNGTRPLSTLSGNVPRHNTERHNSGQSHGIKRTASGLAKALGSQEDSFGYPSLDLSDFSYDAPSHVTTKNGQSVPLSAVLYDENDFDSDLDLDVEDPSTKNIVQYPSLPRAGTVDSTYHSAKTQSPAPKQTPTQQLRSSQPIPWSSSPPEHFKTPPKPQQVPAPTKRRTLPWLKNGSQPKTEAIEDEEREVRPETSRPKKRKSEDDAAIATPAPKSSKPDYPWNTTQSAIKQQQKTLREANKKAVAVKVNDGADDDVKAAVRRKKKSTIHRIFLSEEQQNVLNMVVESKKSVFFTGSAGTLLLPCVLLRSLTLAKVRVNPFFYVKSSQLYEESSSASQTE